MGVYILVTKTYYWNMQKTGNGHNEKWYDPYLQSVALKNQYTCRIGLMLNY